MPGSWHARHCRRSRRAGRRFPNDATLDCAMPSNDMNAAIVTGVSRGLGEALAAALLARGFEVLGIGRVSSMKLGGERYRFAECDLSKPSLIAASVTPGLRDLADRTPRAVTLINNAAVATPARLFGPLGP